MNQQSEARWFVKSFCNPPKVSINRDAMVKRDKKRTRKCFEETQTNQFVCEEWRTNKKEMSRDEWFKLKTHYTYFRY